MFLLPNCYGITGPTNLILSIQMSKRLQKNQKRAIVNDFLRKELCQYAKSHHGTKHHDIVAYFNNKYPELYISRPTVSKIIKDSAKRLLYNLE